MGEWSGVRELLPLEECVGEWTGGWVGLSFRSDWKTDKPNAFFSFLLLLFRYCFIKGNLCVFKVGIVDSE